RGGWATMAVGVPSEPDVFYFGGAGGGVWRTDNAGRSWSPLFQHGPAAAIGAIAVAPSNPQIIYIGTGQVAPRYDIAAGLGVFKSTDGGASWKSLGLADTRYIGSIWIDPHNPDIVLVGAQGHFFGPSTARGVYRSSDGGKTWSHVLKVNDWTGVVDIAGDPKNPRLLFASAWEAHQYPWLSYFTPVAGAGSAIYKSTDGGLTWQRLAGGGWPQVPLGRIGLAVTDTARGTRIYADIDSKTAAGLYRSDDGGAQWARVNKETTFTNWYASRLTVAPNDPDTIYTVGQSIRRCTAGGKTCEIFKGAPGGDDYHYVWINPRHPDHMITGSDQGTVASVDGGQSWSSWYNQPTGQFYHLAADNRFPYWIYSGQQDSGTVGIASRSDYGAITQRQWHPVGGDERDYDIPDPVDPTIVYGSGLGGRVSKWNGRTGQIADVSPWPESSYGKRPTLVRYHYLWTTPLVASRTGPASLYLGAQVLFRTQDRGAHWTTISDNLTGKRANAKNCDGDVTLSQAKPCGYGSISAIEPSPRNSGEIWVGTDDGLIQLTKDGGAHWTDVTPKAVALWAKIAAIDLSAEQPGMAYAAVDGHRIDDFQPHVFRTRDYGQSWRDISTGLPRNHFVSVVRADPVKPGLLYVGTDAGVFVSFDDGGHWAPLGQNFPTTLVNDLLVHGDDLIAATQGRAIWVLDDVTPLRQIAPQSGDAQLFTPAPAWRVHADMNVDTPLPPATPIGQNPPAGAIVDYWLGPSVRGPVTLEIRDAGGALVRRFASNAPEIAPKAERYFAAGWVKPPQQLEASPGPHRFVWNLRAERPPAIDYSYSIAAVWGRGTPVEPQGPLVVPGNYQIVLGVNGHNYSAPLRVTEDPRVNVTSADLKASFDLSERIAQALAQAHKGYGERKFVLTQLDVVLPEAQKSGGRTPQDRLHALGGRIPRMPAAGEPTFEASAAILTSVEDDLESVDAAPTAAQRLVVADALSRLADAQRRWDAVKSGPLPALNAALAHAGRKQIIIPSANALDTEPPDEGQDLP
ncbi:MAG: WD40/YVTN/BNR-like repeat-containing protein, partial [Rhizomicrobium sp.]